MMLVEGCNFIAELNKVCEYWSPRVVGRVNDQYIKVAKLKGQIIWHAHTDEDEMFIIIYGALIIQFEDHEVNLKQGDFYVVPKGVRHNPIAEEECGIVLIETISTLHTGDQISNKSVSIEKQTSSRGF